MRIHILGICGTFMGGLAMLARSLGHEVTGSDANVYPPMSTLLEKQGIDLIQGYDASQLDPQPDCQARSGCMTLSCAIAGYWRLRVRTVKPPPPGWRPGSSKPAAINLAL